MDAETHDSVVSWVFLQLWPAVLFIINPFSLFLSILFSNSTSSHSLSIRETSVLVGMVCAVVFFVGTSIVVPSIVRSRDARRAHAMCVIDTLVCILYVVGMGLTACWYFLVSGPNMSSSNVTWAFITLFLCGFICLPITVIPYVLSVRSCLRWHAFEKTCCAKN